MAIVLVASSCSGEDGADGGVAGGSPAAPAATASAASSASGDEAAASPDPVEGSESAGEAGSSGGAAEQTMRLADEEHALEAASCNLPDQAGGPFRINAETADGRGSLLVVGVGGLGSATIEYDGVSYRSPGASPTFEGSTVSYDGQAASGPLASDTVAFAFTVACP